MRLIFNAADGKRAFGELSPAHETEFVDKIFMICKNVRDGSIPDANVRTAIRQAFAGYTMLFTEPK